MKRREGPEHRLKRRRQSGPETSESPSRRSCPSRGSEGRSRGPRGLAHEAERPPARSSGRSVGPSPHGAEPRSGDSRRCATFASGSTTPIPHRKSQLRASEEHLGRGRGKQAKNTACGTSALHGRTEQRHMMHRVADKRGGSTRTSAASAEAVGPNLGHGWQDPKRRSQHPKRSSGAT